jgi:glycosyltransferase involved in cell wall biosynthesis
VQAPTSRHVLFLNWRDSTNPDGGGSEVYVERIAAELVAHGHRATVICAAHGEAAPEETTAPGVRIIRRGGRHTVYFRTALLYLAGALGLGRLAARRAGRPDVIVDVCNGLPFLSPLYSRKPVLALVHHVHREQWPIVLPRRRARLGWWIESRLAPRVYRRCRYVTVSEATRAELAALGVDPARTTVIHNGTPEAAPMATERSETPSLLVLSRLVPHKRIEVALHTARALADELPDLRLIVAGHGWWEPNLRLIATEMGLGDRVHFTGFVTDDEKRTLLGSAWVALMPSLKEGWGLTIVEAGAQGTPTVAFRGAGGVAEAILDGETGLLADDLDDFVAQVRTLMTDEVARKAMGEAARDYAALFSWKSAGKRFADLVERTLVDRTSVERTRAERT